MVLLLLVLVILPLDVQTAAAAAGRMDFSSILSSSGTGKNLSSPVFNNSGSLFSPSTPPPPPPQQQHKTTTSFISSAPSQPRGGGAATTTLKQKKKSTPKKKPIIGGEECFLPLSSIASLTLTDVATAFRFAIESNRPSHKNGKKILECEQTTRTMAMMRAMEEAARKSRGEGVLPAATRPLDNEALFSSHAFNHDIHDDHHSKTRRRNNKNAFSHLSSSGGFGDIDALQFCAAMRIFAEWRLIRQTPDGYRSYAVGMEIGHKDVVQNVGKIEEAVHQWIELRREEAAAAEDENGEGGGERRRKHKKEKRKNVVIRGPTLRQLLHHEVTQQTHGPTLPKLIDNTAAMGLLWSRRQLQYQTSIFSNVMGIPHVFKDARHAVSEAYHEIYGHLHGWAIQKVFQVSFRSAPDAGLIFRHMNPEEEERVRVKVGRGEILEGGALESEELDDIEEEDEEEERIEEAEMNKVETKEKKKKKKAKVETKEIEVTQTQSGKKLKILRSLGKHGIVRKIFRSKKPKEKNNIIVQPSKKTSLRHKLSVPFTRVIRIHVPSKETMRVSKRKRIAGKIRRVFSFSSSSKSTAAVTPSKELEKSNRFRGGARKVHQEEHQEDKKENKDKTKEGQRERKRKQKKKKKKEQQPINLSHDALEEYVTKQMELDARERIKVYLHVAKPLLNDLEGLFHEMNMEDPTTV